MHFAKLTILLPLLIFVGAAAHGESTASGGYTSIKQIADQYAGATAPPPSIKKLADQYEQATACMSVFRGENGKSVNGWRGCSSAGGEKGQESIEFVKNKLNIQGPNLIMFLGLPYKGTEKVSMELGTTKEKGIGNSVYNYEGDVKCLHGNTLWIHQEYDSLQGPENKREHTNRVVEITSGEWTKQGGQILQITIRPWDNGGSNGTTELISTLTDGRRAPTYSPTILESNYSAATGIFPGTGSANSKCKNVDEEPAVAKTAPPQNSFTAAVGNFVAGLPGAKLLGL